MLYASALLFGLVSYTSAETQHPCSTEEFKQLYDAIRICGRTVGLDSVKFAPLVLISQLRNPLSFLRGEYCAGMYGAGMYGAGCSKLLQLSHEPAYDCDLTIYQGTIFNAFREAPSFCQEENHRSVQLYIQTGKQLGIDVSSSKLVAKIPILKGGPSFAYYFGHHMLQSAENDECLSYSNDQVHTVHCDVESSLQKWSVEQFTSSIKHIQSGLCLEVDPLDVNQVAHLAPCQPSNRNQYISTSAPPASPSRPFSYDMIYTGDDIVTFNAESPTACSWRCEIVDNCDVFTWAEGHCSLLKIGAKQATKLGSVSGHTSKSSQFSVEL